MVRLSDFTFPSNNPPSIIESPVTSSVAKHRIPGRKGNIQHLMGANNMLFNIAGSLYSISTDTDKHFTDLQELIRILMDGKPISFNHNKFAHFGENGDLYTEATTDWITVDCTVTADSSVKKVGSNSIRVDSLAANTTKRVNTPAWFTPLDTNNPHYSSLCFWYRPAGVEDVDDIRIRVWSSDFVSYFYRDIDLSVWNGGLTADTWSEIVLPLGDVVSEDWTTSGTPTWTDISRVTIGWPISGTSEPNYIDGLCITHSVRVTGLPLIRHPSGRPNQINYRLELEQYLG